MEMTISAESREGLGKEAVKKIRDAGKLPAVYYGFDTESKPISLDTKNFDQALNTPKGLNGYFQLTIDGETRDNRVLIRELQRHPVSRRILHVDLVVPNPTKKIEALVPLTFVGRSIGVSTGGRARKPYREITLLGLPQDIPAEIVVDITSIDQGQSIGSEELDTGLCQVVTDLPFVIFKVAAPRGGVKEE
jgi:large subunit ribosomal protein L25